MAKIITEPIYCVLSSSTGNTLEINFIDGSFTYLSQKIKQTFNQLIIDNVGTGDIRFSFINGLDASSATDGTKTLKSGKSVSLEDTIDYIQVYFIGTSQVDLVLKSEPDEEE